MFAPCDRPAGFPARRIGRRVALPCALLVAGLLAAPVATQAPRFYSDDPIAREPDSRDAAGGKPGDSADPAREARLLGVRSDITRTNS